MENNLSKKNYVNNLLNTYFNLFVVIFVSFALFISYFLLLKPKVDDTTNAISDNILSHEKLLEAEKSKFASLQAAVIAYKSIDPVDAARVNAILPDEYDKEALYGEIEELVKSNGFIPTLITLSKVGEGSATSSDSTATTTTATSKIGTINISLTIASIDYAGTKNLLSILENNLRLLDVEQVTFSGSSADLKMNTYYYKK